MHAHTGEELNKALFTCSAQMLTSVQEVLTTVSTLASTLKGGFSVTVILDTVLTQMVIHAKVAF